MLLSELPAAERKHLRVVGMPTSARRPRMGIVVATGTLQGCDVAYTVWEGRHQAPPTADTVVASALLVVTP